MADLNNAKIYRRVSKTGTDQYAVVNLDATHFCITLSGGNTTSLVSALSRFVDVNTDDQEIFATKIFSKYLVVYDDEEEFSEAPRPTNSTGLGDSDLYIYSTGLTVHDSNQNKTHKYSFPDHTGTFAMTNDIGLVLLDLRGQDA